MLSIGAWAQGTAAVGSVHSLEPVPALKVPSLQVQEATPFTISHEFPVEPAGAHADCSYEHVCYSTHASPPQGVPSFFACASADIVTVCWLNRNMCSLSFMAFL